MRSFMVNGVALLTMLCSVASLIANEPQLSLTGHFTYGYQGAKRTNSFIPAEVLFYTVRCSNASLTEGGTFSYRTKVTLLNSQGEEVETSASEPKEVKSLFGGKSFSFPGAYRLPSTFRDSTGTLVLSVTDFTGRKSAELRLPIKLLPLDSFEAMNLRFERLFEGVSYKAGGCFNVGDEVFLNAFVFGLQPKEDVYKLAFHLRILDKNKRPIKGGEKAASTEVSDSGLCPISVSIPLHEPGVFYAELELEDAVSKKKCLHVIPFQVSDLSQLK